MKEIEKERSGQEELTELMKEYQAGSFRAFERLYSALRNPIFAYLLSQLWNRSRAQDLLQETFLQLHKSRQTYLPGKPVKPWAFGIARNVLLMDRRSRSSYRYESLDFEELAEPSSSPELDEFADREAALRVLSSLSTDQREVLLLHYFWGFTYPEIGALIGIRSGTARVRAHRAMNTLRSELEQLGVTDRSL